MIVPDCRRSGGAAGRGLLGEGDRSTAAVGAGRDGRRRAEHREQPRQGCVCGDCGERRSPSTFGCCLGKPWGRGGGGPDEPASLDMRRDTERGNMREAWSSSSVALPLASWSSPAAAAARVLRGGGMRLQICKHCPAPTLVLSKTCVAHCIDCIWTLQGWQAAHAACRRARSVCPRSPAAGQCEASHTWLCGHGGGWPRA